MTDRFFESLPRPERRPLYSPTIVQFQHLPQQQHLGSQLKRGRKAKKKGD